MKTRRPFALNVLLGILIISLALLPSVRQAYFQSGQQ